MNTLNAKWYLTQKNVNDLKTQVQFDGCRENGQYQFDLVSTIKQLTTPRMINYFAYNEEITAIMILLNRFKKDFQIEFNNGNWRYTTIKVSFDERNYTIFKDELDNNEKTFILTDNYNEFIGNIQEIYTTIFEKLKNELMLEALINRLDNSK